MNSKFKELLEECRSIGDDKGCVPIAVAALTGFSYTDVEELFREKGRKKKEGVYFNTTREVLEELGLTLHEVNYENYGKTIRTFCRNIDSDNKYIIRVRRHVLAVVDGDALDWTNGRCHRILECFRVEGY